MKRWTKVIVVCVLLTNVVVFCSISLGYTDYKVSDTQQEVRFSSDKVICVEGLLDGQWVNRYWTADGRINLRYEKWINEAFYVEIDNVPLSRGWQLAAINKVSETDKGARHFVVELTNTTQPLNIKLHTLLDGTPILTRWIEITNTSDKPAALTAIAPWTGKLWAHRWVLPNLPPQGSDHGFTLGYFHQNYRRIETGHGMEGWFQWEELPVGTTEIGCDKGQCYDDPFFILRNEAKGQYTICHLAWSTNWYATFDCQNELGQQTVQFKIGPKAADALCVLSPGETTVHRGEKYRVTIDSLGETFIIDGLTLITNGLPTRLEVLSQSELFLFEEVK